VVHSLEGWRSVIEHGAADPGASSALRLYEWLLGQPGCSATTTGILKRATPHALRGRDTRDAALDRLQAHRLIQREGPLIWALLVAECQS
jgi:hypothetical protein